MYLKLKLFIGPLLFIAPLSVFGYGVISQPDCTSEAVASTAFWDGCAGDIDNRFELAKRTTPELITFMKRMPKGGDLHVHLGGSSFSENILIRAQENGLNYDKNKQIFTDEPLGRDVI